MTRAGARWRAAARLVPPTARLLPWWHLAAGAGLAAAVVWLRWAEGWRALPAVVQSLRLAMLPLALSAAFVLDDAAEPTLAACPVPASLRRALRVAVALTALAAAWAGLLASVAAAGPPSWPVPVAALSLELAALSAVTLAAAALAGRGAGSAAGGAAAPATLATALALWLLPDTLAFYAPYAPAPGPGRPPGAGWAAWVGAHWRWAALACAALAALAWASRDAGRRGRIVPRTSRARRLTPRRRLAA